MTDDQHRRALAFAELHRGPGPLVVANAWDAGTARLLAGLGFAALATTSGGLALSLGRRDGADQVGRDEVLRNAREVASATPLPVTADLEGGYGQTPEAVAETIRLAAGVGLVGGSVEDATGRADAPIRELGHAVELVAAAVEAARALPFPFTVTARAENFLHGRADLDDTVRRLQAYEAAGADVLYAPGLPDAAAIAAVCRSVGRPVNVLAADAGGALSVAELGTLGARRISLGSTLSRVALGAVAQAAREIATSGTFARLGGAAPSAELVATMEEGRG